MMLGAVIASVPAWSRVSSVDALASTFMAAAATSV
jgi:hypothetical protein